MESSSLHTLARFCNCRGSVAYVHRTCLERWRDRQLDDICELCGVKYNTARHQRKEADASTALPGSHWNEHPWKSYTLTALFVWLWLWRTGTMLGCEEVVTTWSDMFTK